MLSFTALLAIARHVAVAKSAPPPRRLHAYQNPSLYNAALTGYIAGVCQARGYGTPAYLQIKAEAAVFAAGVDAMIPTDPTLNAAKVSLMEDLTSSLLSLRGAVPALLVTTVAMVVTLYQETLPSLVGAGGSVAASDVSYVDTPPLLHADNVQSAIDALKMDIGGGTALTAPFLFTTGSPLVLQAVTAGQVITRAVVTVETAFNDPSASMTLGTTTDPSEIFGASDIDTNVENQYETDLLTTFTIPDFLILTVSPGSSTQGAGTLFYWLQ